jgi:threonine dehydratase
LPLVDALAARRRIAPYVRRTPLVDSAWLSDATGGPVSLKLESLQVTSSFKARGAFNAVLALRERGFVPSALVTASAGNHGRAMAAAAAVAGWPLIVFTPRDAPRVKLEAIRRHGAELRADAVDYDEAERSAKAHARETGAAFVSAYSDPDVMAGAATIALEIFEAGEYDVLVVPIGGGGLIAGVAEAAKAIAPACRVIGVEAAASCPFQTSVRAGRLTTIVPGPTLADGLAGNPDPDTITFTPIQQFVDDIVTVTEAELARGIGGLVDAEHVVAEGAGAVAAAALLAGRIQVRGRRAAAIVSGGNIDRSKLTAVLTAPTA